MSGINNCMEILFQIIDIDKMDSLLVCGILLSVVILKDIKVSENLKVAILYIVTFVMLFCNIDVWKVLFLFLLASFILIEIITEDDEKKHLFNFFRKIVDYLFRMFFEYYCILYVSAVTIMCVANETLEFCQINKSELGMCTSIMQSTLAWSALLIAVVLLISSVFCTTRLKFQTKTISGIMCNLDAIPMFSTNFEGMAVKYNILVSMEDRTFFERRSTTHSSVNARNAKIAMKKIRECLRMVKCIPCAVKDFLKRGYGTIEMQLIRTIGIERGYDNCTVRRKIYEIVYSNMIFNSKRCQLSRQLRDGKEYKCWILDNYLRYVSVYFGKRIFPSGTNSTAQVIFGKDFLELSEEEFFVWCIALVQYLKIGDNTIQRHDYIITQYSLDNCKIKKALDVTYGH